MLSFFLFTQIVLKTGLIFTQKMQGFIFHKTVDHVGQPNKNCPSELSQFTSPTGPAISNFKMIHWITIELQEIIRKVTPCVILHQIQCYICESTSPPLSSQLSLRYVFVLLLNLKAPRHFVCVLSLTVFTSYYVKGLRLRLTASYAAFPDEKWIKRCRDGHKEWIVILQMSEGIMFAINKSTTKYTFFIQLRNSYLNYLHLVSNLEYNGVDLGDILPTVIIQLSTQ